MKTLSSALLSIACLLALSGVSVAQLAQTPPMGWNSWDSYGLSVKETEFKQNADWMAAHLKQFGWQYMVVDEGWYLANPESGGKPAWQFTISNDGRYLPAPNRFPSAADGHGFKPLADYVHGLGLNFGVHIIRGIPKEAVAKNLPIADSSFHAADAADTSDTCPWNPDNYGVKDTPAGQAYYDSIAKLYASWGVDFVKVDCIADHPYKPAEIRMFSEALRKSGRPIVLSLSPGPTALDKAAEVRKYAQMWRIADDFWDDWKRQPGDGWKPTSLLEEFGYTAKWAQYTEPGHWPDADMLPIGYLGYGNGNPHWTKFTHDEQRTMMTLWCIFRSPLFIGADLKRNDEWTTSLLTNPEVLAVNQHSKDNRQLSANETAVVWRARSEDNKYEYVALFNISDQQQTLHYSWKDLDLTVKRYATRDLWQRKDVGTAEGLNVALAPHASVLFRLERK